jgi:hypothetical protein
LHPAIAPHDLGCGFAGMPPCPYLAFAAALHAFHPVPRVISWQIFNPDKITMK